MAKINIGKDDVDIEIDGIKLSKSLISGIDIEAAPGNLPFLSLKMYIRTHADITFDDGVTLKIDGEAIPDTVANALYEALKNKFNVDKTT